MCLLLWWIGQGGNFYSLFGPKNTNLIEDVKILLPVRFRWIPFSGFREKVKICPSHSEARAAILFFFISPKNTNFEEDVEILLPVKFCWILFSGFRGKVENVSANHRPGRPFCFPDPPEKHKLGRGRWDLASYQISSNSFHSFREVANVSANQRPGRPFCFSWFAWKTQTW